MDQLNSMQWETSRRNREERGGCAKNSAEIEPMRRYRRATSEIYMAEVAEDDTPA